MEDERERVRIAADSQGRAPGVDEVGHGRLGLKVKRKPQPSPHGPCHDQP